MPRNIALVGCGAIAQAFYLPALARLRGEFDRISLVDPSERARASATALLPVDTVPHLADIAEAVTFVVIAAPNAGHFALAQEALLRGAHVLIEKPFVIFPEQGQRLATIAAAQQRTIAINQTRRLFPVVQELRQRIATGEFGALRAIEHFEGVKLNWPFESGAAFARDAERTGVMMDFGVHALDFYQYVLQPTWKFISATHDGFHGPEGLADIRLEASGVPVTMRLSRYQTQENVARMTFEKEEVIASVFDWNTYTIRGPSGSVRRIATATAIRDYTDLALRLVHNFVAAGEGRGSVLCDAASSLPVIEILDEIYRGAGRYPMAVGAV